MDLVSSDIESYARDHASVEDPLFAELTEETQRMTQFPNM